jgi:hypothetical protein
MKKIILFAPLLVLMLPLRAQELNARVNVNTTRVSTSVNKSTFVTLKNAITNFLNNRKWTGDAFAANEKIDCNIMFNLEQTSEPNVYSATMSIQAARPVYHTSYLSPLINFQDENVNFKYIEFQQLEFNENRISGSDPMVSNLTAILAYYAYMILGFDYDSYSPKGGEKYFQKAQNIINNAPDGRGISGWKAFDGMRNRYWLVENMLNTRYQVMHDVYYNYYHMGMDKLYDEEKTARTELLNVLNLMDNFNTENPNTMISQFFFLGKSTEWIQVFSKAAPPEKARARDLLSKLDLTNSSKYKESLK